MLLSSSVNSSTGSVPWLVLRPRTVQRVHRGVPADHPALLHEAREGHAEGHEEGGRGSHQDRRKCLQHDRHKGCSALRCCYFICNFIS